MNLRLLFCILFWTGTNIFLCNCGSVPGVVTPLLAQSLSHDWNYCSFYLMNNVCPLCTLLWHIPIPSVVSILYDNAYAWLITMTQFAHHSCKHLPVCGYYVHCYGLHEWTINVYSNTTQGMVRVQMYIVRIFQLDPPSSCPKNE